MKPTFHLESLPEMLLKIEKSNKIPLGIELIDNLVGGIISGHLHAILGESGSGKTWFCLKAINSMLKINSLAKIGYIDFSLGNNIYLIIRSL